MAHAILTKLLQRRPKLLDTGTSLQNLLSKRNGVLISHYEDQINCQKNFELKKKLNKRFQQSLTLVRQESKGHWPKKWSYCKSEAASPVEESCFQLVTLWKESGTPVT